MFWIISAILTIIALAFILPALFRSDNEQDATREQNIAIAKEQLDDLEHRFEKNELDKESYQSIKDELEQSLFSDLNQPDTNLAEDSNVRKTGILDTWPILLLIPLIAIPVYLNLGNLDFAKQLDPKVVAQEAIRASMPLKPDGTPDVEKITNNLRAEMESNPTDPKGWYMLGRSYMLLKRFPEAAESFDKSLSLRPDRVETMLSLADALSMDNEGKLFGRPRELVNKSLESEPQNITALWLSGMAASQEGEYPIAITQWQKVLQFLDDKPEEKTAVTNLIAEAKSRLNSEQKNELANNTKEISTAETSSDSEQASESNGSENQSSEVSNAAVKNVEANEGLQAKDDKDTISEIKVSISLAESLKSQASSDDYVFIYAKAMSGPPMPLAAVRKQVKDLPLEVVLNDEMAMMPALKLSDFKDVIVGARISKSGQPIPQNGDLYNEKTSVKSGDNVSLEINQVYQK